MSRTLRFIAAIVSSCLLAMALSAVAVAAPGDVDRTFGREGVVDIESPPPVDYAVPVDMVVRPDGGIYVLQAAQRCPGPAGCVWEALVSGFLSSGAVDHSFGADGTSKAIGPAGGFQLGERASLALGPDGRLVVAWTEGGKLALARLDRNGGLDSSFGAGGTIRVDLGTPLSGVRAAVGSDGKVIVAAEPEPGYGGGAVLIARYTVQGASDSTFNDGSPVVTSLGSGFGGFAIAGAGSVLVAGPRCCGVVGRAVHIARLDEAGAFDSSFGREGARFIDDVSDGASVGAVVPLENGRIYVVGSGGGAGDAFVLRLRPNGKLDARFGHRGVAYMRRSLLRVAGAVVDGAGRLLIFGGSPSSSLGGPLNGSDQLTVARRLPNGRRDPTFAGGSPVRLRSLSGAAVVSGGLQERRMLVILAATGSCIRTCPSQRNLLIRFLGGDSRSRCKGHRATIVGTRHGEKLVGTRHRDVIAGLAGNDTVLGRGGDDIICGGRGNDRLIGGRGRDTLLGGPGRNSLRQ
jgi:uncharacterized delta-60 repeat protein